jgi:hypothetical protein
MNWGVNASLRWGEVSERYRLEVTTGTVPLSRQEIPFIIIKYITI